FNESDYEQMPTYMDEDKAEAEIEAEIEAEVEAKVEAEVEAKAEVEAEVSKSSPTQSEGGSSIYQDRTTSNFKKHLKKHKNKVPELKKSNIKQG
ncbi:40494_t:CDS:2, partial [Gigaspora margarita]